MTILLTVLKIIGIVLLVLLCLLLAVVLLVLFVPIRYRADGAYQEKPDVKLQITWLLHLLTVRVSFDGSLSYYVKAAGIRLLPKSADKPSKNGKKAEAGEKESSPDAAPKQEECRSEEPLPTSHEDKAAQETETAAEATAEAKPETAAEAKPKTAAEAKPETGSEASADAGPAGDAAEQGDAEGCADAHSAQKEEPDAHAAEGSESKRAAFFDKIYAFFIKFRDKLANICDKIKNIQETISYYTAVLEREETKQALRLVKNQLFKIVKHLLPRKLDVCLVIGTGDPASTGQIMAMQGILYPLLRGNVRIIPDFENKHVEGTFHIKGRITAVRLLVCGLRVIINKNFRQLIRLLRKKEEA